MDTTIEKTVFDSLAPHFTRSLQQGLSQWLESNPEVFDSFLNSEGTVIVSDYGQDCPKTPYQVYSFLVMPASELSRWSEGVLAFRKNRYPEKANFEFKALGDRKRMRLLPEFLACASICKAFTITLLVPREIRWAFPNDLRESANPEFVLREYLDLEVKPHIAEKILRIAHAGVGALKALPSAGKTVFFHVDRDAVTNNPQKFIELLRGLLEQYFEREIQHLVFAQDDGSRAELASDLLCIPDLICGTITEIHNRTNGNPHKPSTKSATILTWMHDQKSALKHCVLKYCEEDINDVPHVLWAKMVYKGSPPPEEFSNLS